MQEDNQTTTASSIGDTIKKVYNYLTGTEEEYEGMLAPSNRLPHDEGYKTNRPFIAILTQDIGQSYYEARPDTKGKYRTYLMDAYVKYIQTAGARVTPIVYTDDWEKIEAQLEKVNGFIFPGGAMVNYNDDGTPTEYTLQSQKIYKWIKEKNDAGVYFPAWGICQGFQQMHNMEVEQNVLDDHVRDDNADPLEFIVDPKESRLFCHYSDDMIKAMQEEHLAYNHHDYSVSHKTYEKYPGLGEAFTPLAVQKDTDGVEYIACVEHKKYPIYGVQFHPEKNHAIFYEQVDVPHSDNANRFGVELAFFFACESKKNDHKFENYDEECDAMIEHYHREATTRKSVCNYLFE